MILPALVIVLMIVIVVVLAAVVRVPAAAPAILAVVRFPAVPRGAIIGSGLAVIVPAAAVGGNAALGHAAAAAAVLGAAGLIPAPAGVVTDGAPAVIASTAVVGVAAIVLVVIPAVIMLMLAVVVAVFVIALVAVVLVVVIPAAATPADQLCSEARHGLRPHVLRRVPDVEHVVECQERMARGRRCLHRSDEDPDGVRALLRARLRLERDIRSIRVGGEEIDIDDDALDLVVRAPRNSGDGRGRQEDGVLVEVHADRVPGVPRDSEAHLRLHEQFDLGGGDRRRDVSDGNGQVLDHGAAVVIDDHERARVCEVVPVRVRDRERPHRRGRIVARGDRERVHLPGAPVQERGVGVEPAGVRERDGDRGRGSFIRTGD